LRVRDNLAFWCPYIACCDCRQVRVDQIRPIRNRTSSTMTTVPTRPPPTYILFPRRVR
jgi:hypothetical protein